MKTNHRRLPPMLCWFREKYLAACARFEKGTRKKGYMNNNSVIQHGLANLASISRRQIIPFVAAFLAAATISGASAQQASNRHTYTYTLSGKFAPTYNPNPLNGSPNTGVFDSLSGSLIGYRLSFPVAAESRRIWGEALEMPPKDLNHRPTMRAIRAQSRSRGLGPSRPQRWNAPGRRPAGSRALDAAVWSATVSGAQPLARDGRLEGCGPSQPQRWLSFDRVGREVPRPSSRSLPTWPVTQRSRRKPRSRANAGIASVTAPSRTRSPVTARSWPE